MRLKFGMKYIGVFAALTLLAACETAQQDTAGAAGEGAAVGGTAAAAPQEGVTTTTTAGPQAGSQEDLVVNVGDRVFFGFDRHDLDAESMATLDRQAAWMKAHPTVTITVEGHCDERGTREYNLALGERRATAVKNYLISLGVDPNRVATISYGKERPVALGSNESAWSQNRRGVAVVN